MAPNFATLDPTKIDGMKNGELNQWLGTDGAPRFSANQMKTTTKSKLQDMLLTEYTSWKAEQPTGKARRKKNEGVSDRPKADRTGAIERVSLNKDCAASKKCNLIKALIAGKKTLEQVQKTYEFDDVLQDYWPIDKYKADIIKAQAGERPKQGKAIQLVLDLA